MRFNVTSPSFAASSLAPPELRTCNICFWRWG